MLALTAPTAMTNDKNGSGKYKPLRRRKKHKQGENSEDFSYLKDSEDLTMHFSTARDPIYFVFEKIENRSVSSLMTEFVKDSFFEISKFVSKVMK